MLFASLPPSMLIDSIVICHVLDYVKYASTLIEYTSSSTRGGLAQQKNQNKITIENIVCVGCPEKYCLCKIWAKFTCFEDLHQQKHMTMQTYLLYLPFAQLSQHYIRTILLKLFSLSKKCVSRSLMCSEGDPSTSHKSTQQNSYSISH